jgi:hypothetical protein
VENDKENIKRNADILVLLTDKFLIKYGVLPDTDWLRIEKILHGEKSMISYWQIAIPTNRTKGEHE